MIRRITMIAALLAALAAIGGYTAQAAHAACQADGGGTGYVSMIYPYTTPGHDGYDGAAAITCTTNNGRWYELRMYFQADNGGWHILSSRDSDYATTTNQIFGCSSCGPVADNFHYTQHFAMFCGFVNLFPQFLHIRVKAVVENLQTHTTDVAYGTSTVTRGGCDGT